MQTDTYLTLHSGTSDANDFTTTLNPLLTVGECWEVAVTQVHLPGGGFKEAFQRAFPNNPTLGELEIDFKSSARNDLQLDTGKKSVRLNDILGDIAETTTKYDVLQLIYNKAWNEIAAEKTPGKSMVLRKNNGDFIPQVFKQTPRGIKLEATASHLGYLALHKSLAQMMGIVNAAGMGLGHGVRYETRSLADMQFRTTYSISGDLIKLYDGVDWFFPGLSSPWSLSLQKTHVDLHCDVVRAQHANGQRVWTHVESPSGGGTLTPTVHSYIPLAQRELKTIRIWITETGTDTKVTLPTNQKTRITLHFRKTL